MPASRRWILTPSRSPARRNFVGGSPTTTRAWRVETGSALDDEYLELLGTHDLVYSWGVLHDTGDLWRALDNTALCVAPGGKLYIAIYNDQGSASRRRLGWSNGTTACLAVGNGWFSLRRSYGSGDRRC